MRTAPDAPDAAPGADTVDTDDEATHILCRLGEVLAERDMTLTELSARTGITVVNLSVLKNIRARAIRFSTLDARCRELDCQPSDILSYQPTDPDDPRG